VLELTGRAALDAAPALPVPCFHMPVKSRKALFAGLVVLLAGFLFYHFRASLHLNQFSVTKMWQALKGADPLYISAAVVLIYVCYLLRAVRWSNFQKGVGPSRVIPIFKMTLAGFSAVFLFGRVGEPIRPMLISRKEKIPLADTFGIYALERFLDLAFSVAVLASWFLTVTIQNVLRPGESTSVLESARKTAGTILTLGIIGLLVLVVYLRVHGANLLEGRMQVWLAIHGWRSSVARIVLGIARGLKSMRTWRDLVYAVIVSAAHWFLVILIYYLVAQSFGGKLASLRFQDSILILALTLVGSLFQLPGIGGGPQAVMIGTYTRLFDVPGEVAVAAAMVIYLVTFGACTFAGVPLLIREGWSLGELKRMREHEDEEIDAEIAHPSAKSL
jgi:glycosyltransferase 2 family protein